ncbi:D-alanyl-D-alanine carboxypeptidase [Methyloceanibacter methanicus]|uniref:D-alanyl-D-alanine carboxypeptidase n=1 Tax=Methyloceanibacter methanicus TaxID=1774968 RepID=UPI0013016B98|nr:D-alanyl-D-alanine carboxypeptidase [Methyloceanibacter methanicus]
MPGGLARARRDADRPRRGLRGQAGKGAIIVDANTNNVLYSQSADVLRSPASLTKIMTLYVLFAYMRAGRFTPDTKLKVSKHAASQAPTKLYLKPGSTISVKDCIKALVTKSANDAAAVVAENVGGTEENFARIMTQTAHNLGMKRTTYRNASGLPNNEQLTTARDQAILAMHIMRDYPEYYTVFETKYFDYKGRKYRNHNRLLFSYKGTTGIKTGYTRASGFNLTAAVERDDKHLIGVVLGGQTSSLRNAAMVSLLDKHWSKASSSKRKPTSFIASLLGAPTPPPPSRKPIFSVASAAVPVATRTPAPAPAVQQAAADPVVAQPAVAQPAAQRPFVQASLSPTRLSAPSPAAADRMGSYHVQVGSYASPADAQNRLGMVRQRAPKLLEGHLPFTATFYMDDKEWYRARFAGFSKDDARSTCEALKRMRLDCIALAAE